MACSPDSPAPAFVVSTGRSGSTLVSDIARLHPSLLSISEVLVLLGEHAFPPEPIGGERFWQLVGSPNPRHTFILRNDVGFDEWLYRPGPGTRFTAETGVPPLLLTALPHLTDRPEELFDELASWVPSLDARPAAEQYRRLFGWLCRRFGRRTWVERSGLSLLLLPQLIEHFPEARFVHVYRDGRECAVSMSRHNGFKLLAVSARLVQAGPGQDARAPDTFDREAFLAMEVPAHVMGAFWSDLVLDGCRRLDDLEPERTTRLCYEALVAEPERELRRLARFLGVEEDEDWLRRAAALPQAREPRWRRLPEPEQARLNEACAPGLEQLYGGPDGPR